MSSDSSLILLLPHMGTVLSLGLLFILTTIWLKSTVRGFGLMALAEVLDLAARAVGPFLASLGMDYNTASVFWIAAGIVRLVGAYMLYKHYLEPEIAPETSERVADHSAESK